MRDGASTAHSIAASVQPTERLRDAREGPRGPATPRREAEALERMREGARWLVSIGAVTSIAGALVHASLTHGVVRVAGLLAIAGGLVLVAAGVRWLRLLAHAGAALDGPVREVLLVRHLELLSRTEPWNSELLAWDAHEHPLAKLGAWQ
jgi:hypothetical protein